MEYAQALQIFGDAVEKAMSQADNNGLTLIEQSAELRRLADELDDE